MHISGRNQFTSLRVKHFSCQDLVTRHPFIRSSKTILNHGMDLCTSPRSSCVFDYFRERVLMLDVLRIWYLVASIYY